MRRLKVQFLSVAPYRINGTVAELVYCTVLLRRHTYIKYRWFKSNQFHHNNELMAEKLGYGLQNHLRWCKSN